MSGSFGIFRVMKIKVLPFGTLKVKAGEMVNGLSAAKIRERYHVDPEGNMRISMNMMLADTGERVVLFDPGTADFLPARLKTEYGLEQPGSLEQILNEAGYEPGQVTDVIFTHLHFDHGSGAFRRVPGKIVKRFPEADYHVLKAHFDYASGRNKKESAYFITLFFRNVDQIRWLEEWRGEWMDYQVFHGHTRGMVVPRILTGEGEVYYVSDLIPMEIFLDQDACSGYDRDPELARKEKTAFLEGLDRPSELVLFHDPVRPAVDYPPDS
ncbi:MAG TPA: MBL fold metallo-hydrolase [Bacteroides sp.]|mgnify:CR=1 FL=1|nr:MBL fold metallo-hydrolase [Bacteroides sp.]